MERNCVIKNILIKKIIGGLNCIEKTGCLYCFIPCKGW